MKNLEKLVGVSIQYSRVGKPIKSKELEATMKAIKHDSLYFKHHTNPTIKLVGFRVLYLYALKQDWFTIVYKEFNGDEGGSFTYEELHKHLKPVISRPLNVEDTNGVCKILRYLYKTNKHMINDYIHFYGKSEELKTKIFN